MKTYSGQESDKLLRRKSNEKLNAEKAFKQLLFSYSNSPTR